MSNKWRVPNFVHEIDLSVKTRKRKRKTSVNIRKNEPSRTDIQATRPQTPVLQEICTESSSPIIGNYKNTALQNSVQNCVNNSPVLNSELTNSQSDTDTSPVINRNINKIIKLRKNRLSLKNQVGCVRQLKELEVSNNVVDLDKENRIRKVCEWMNEEENYEIEVENSQPSPAETPIIAQKQETVKKSWIKFDKTKDKRCSNNSLLNTNTTKDKSDILECSRDDETNIELVNSQDLFEHSARKLTSTIAAPLWNCNMPTNSSNVSCLEPLLTNKFPESTQHSPSNLRSNHSTNNTQFCSKKSSKSFRQLYSQEDHFEIELVSSQESNSVPLASGDGASPQIQVSDVSSPRAGSDKVDSSQTSSVASINSNYTVVPDSLEGSSYETLYNSPKKTRKYKPGTLCHQFYKILRRQRADVGIWRHEMYLSGTSSYKMPSTKDDALITDLEIVKISSDFGCTVLECVEVALSTKCLALVDVSDLKDQTISKGTIIKIYPPYFVKYYNINDENNVKTFVNVHKITSVNK